MRIQSMNGVDLNRFPFEYDLTWMSFFQNAAGRTYTRYGGRDDEGPESQLNQRSLVRVMRQVLDLHQTGDVKPPSQYEPVDVAVYRTEDIPTMKQMLAKRKVKCIHCHDVKSTQLKNLRRDGKFDRKMIFTYPSPANLGIQLNPTAQNEVESVDGRSAAQISGIEKGDVIKKMDGQRVLTFADATRILELTPESGNLSVQIERDGKMLEKTIKLPRDWRISGDPSWRESTHVAGPNSGFWAVELNDQQRKRLRIANDQLALKATAIWGGWTRRAGVKHGDIVISIDGISRKMGIKQLQTYLQMNKNWGDAVPLVVVRGGQRKKLTMKLPDRPTD